MKKIFFLLFAVCALIACDPVQEDISNGGHITVEELIAKSQVTTDSTADGQTGNVVTCTTSAPVNATWDIGGKAFIGNFAKRKMKVGSHTVTLTAICADGTELKAEFPVSCQVITEKLTRYWVYGDPDWRDPDDPDKRQLPFVPAAWNANYMRFSDTEGTAGFRFLTDDEYWGCKTLVFDVSDASDDLTLKVMSGWWTTVNHDDVHFKNGLNEFNLTEDIAKVCAKGNGGQGQDLTLMVTSGTCKINAVYYEE